MPTDLMIELRRSIRRGLDAACDGYFFDVFFSTPLSAIRSPHPRHWRCTPIPMLVVRFRDEDVVDSQAFHEALEQGQKTKRTPGQGTQYRGYPILAVVWNESEQATYVTHELRTIGVPTLRVSKEMPLTWLRKEILSFADPLYRPPIVRGLISDEQEQIAQGLRELENRWYMASAVVEDHFMQIALLQEVHAPYVIGCEQEDAYNAISNKRFDFVLFQPARHKRYRGRWVPFLAIEYDGRQHRYSLTQMRVDQATNDICLAARLPLLRIDARFLPPNPLYAGRDRNAKRRQKFLNNAIWEVAFECSTLGRRDQDAARRLRRISRIRDNDWKSEELHSFFWDENHWPQIEWELDQKCVLDRIYKITKDRWNITFHERHNGQIYASMRNNTRNLTLPLHPGLTLHLYSKSISLDMRLLTEKIVFRSSILEILQYYELDIDDVDVPLL